jgi:hypothetical protein
VAADLASAAQPACAVERRIRAGRCSCPDGSAFDDRRRRAALAGVVEDKVRQLLRGFEEAR